jgi:hypothetical protein
MITFMNWADSNGFRNALAGRDDALPALQAYFNCVRDRVARGEISLNFGAREQLDVANSFAIQLEDDELFRYLDLLKKDPSSTNSTSPPCEETESKVLALSSALFDGLSELVLNASTYPHAIRMPKYLLLPEDRLWIFPQVSWFETPSMREEPGRRLTRGIRYEEGRYLSTAEVQMQAPGLSYGAANLTVRTLREQLKAANSDPHHFRRRQVAANAMNAYLLLFVAQTSMNWAQVCELPWDRKFEVVPERQNFRTIKYRAGNRPVSFELPVTATNTFRRYLEIREYLLKGAHFEKLFFTLGDNGKGRPHKLKLQVLPIYPLLKRIDPALVLIQSRQWRAAKSDWLIQNKDVSTTALILQNSEKTVLKSYAQGAEKTHHVEMTSFLEGLTDKIHRSNREPVTEKMKSSVGACASYGSPIHASSEVAVAPDCNTPEGCLFCEQYRVHATEVDIRKLVSCRYVLRQTTFLARSEEEYQTSVEPVFEALQKLLGEIAKMVPLLVLKIESEVDNDGELDGYWASKLQMLFDLGMIK